MRRTDTLLPQTAMLLRQNEIVTLLQQIVIDTPPHLTATTLEPVAAVVVIVTAIQESMTQEETMIPVAITARAMGIQLRVTAVLVEDRWRKILMDRVEVASVVVTEGEEVVMGQVKMSKEVSVTRPAIQQRQQIRVHHMVTIN